MKIFIALIISSLTCLHVHAANSFESLKQVLKDNINLNEGKFFEIGKCTVSLIELPESTSFQLIINKKIGKGSMQTRTIQLSDEDNSKMFIQLKNKSQEFEIWHEVKDDSNLLIGVVTEVKNFIFNDKDKKYEKLNLTLYSSNENENKLNVQTKIGKLEDYKIGSEGIDCNE